MTDPIRIFIGSEPKVRIAEQVLIYSIRARTEAATTFTIMDGDGWQVPSDLRQGTGFSLRRWMIPQFCGFKGRAIYLDADMLVHADIKELWDMPDTTPNPEACIWCAFEVDKYNRVRPAMQSSMMVIDCERAHEWQVPKIWDYMRRGMSYPEFMHARWVPRAQIQEISKAWNSFNRYTDGVTKLTHYTVEQRQPWYRPEEHQLTSLWERELIAAIKHGAIKQADFEHALARYGKPDPGDRRRTYGIHPHFSHCRELFGS